MIDLTSSADYLRDTLHFADQGRELQRMTGLIMVFGIRIDGGDHDGSVPASNQIVLKETGDFRVSPGDRASLWGGSRHSLTQAGDRATAHFTVGMELIPAHHFQTTAELHQRLVDVVRLTTTLFIDVLRSRRTFLRQLLTKFLYREQ